MLKSFKSLQDLVNADPSKREVTFERCLSYAAQNLGDDNNNTSSWVGMDSCHEISARDDTGVEEVFQVITRKLGILSPPPFFSSFFLVTHFL